MSWGKVANEVLQEQEFHLRSLLIWTKCKQDITKKLGTVGAMMPLSIGI